MNHACTKRNPGQHRALAALCATLAWGLCCSSATAKELLYAAVPGGSVPGIYQLQDSNGNGDARDAGESLLYAQLPEGPTDVAVAGTGVMFAITGGAPSIYRIEDQNGDGDARDAGETTVFRSHDASIASGALLKRPTSLAVSTFLDPFSGKLRLRLYSMDVVLQKALVLEDLDGDGDANDASELAVIAIAGYPFTPERMVLDGAGRAVAVNANRLSLVRLRDLNGDFEISQAPREHLCPVVVGSCGAAQVTDFQTIRSPQSAQKLNLQGPYGVTLLADASWLVSDPAADLIYRFADLDLDEDAQSDTEITLYAEIAGLTDLTSGEQDVVLVGTADSKAEVLRLEDIDGSGSVSSAERKVFADLPGTPTGLDLLRPFEMRTLRIEAASGFEQSPLKGPMLVLEPGATAQIGMRIVDADSGTPAAHLRVANGVMIGCLSVCSAPVNQTDANGMIGYTVKRTADYGTAEAIKFWTEDGSGGIAGGPGNLQLPVVRTPCTPAPVAAAGADLLVAPGANVQLDGTASSGAGLKYCWTQVAGVAAGLAECTGDEPVVGFTAPAAPGAQEFSLQVRNACDVISQADNMTVRVADTTPDPFSFPAVVDVPLNSWVKSKIPTLTGFDGNLPISVVGSQYRLQTNGVWGSFTSSPGSVSAGQKVQLQVKSASAYNTTVNATLFVGNVSAQFSVTTMAAP